MLISTCMLLDFLKKNNLIALTGNLDVTNFGAQVVNARYADANFIDSDIQSKIVSFSRRRITPTESLIQIAKNEFKTEERIRYEKELKNTRIQIDQNQKSIDQANEQLDINKKQIKWALLALFISMISLIISVLVPLYVTTIIDFKQKSIKLDTNVSSLPDINQTLIELNSSIAKDRFRVELDQNQIDSISGKIDQLINLVERKNKKIDGSKK